MSSWVMWCDWELFCKVWGFGSLGGVETNLQMQPHIDLGDWELKCLLCHFLLLTTYFCQRNQMLFSGTGAGVSPSLGPHQRQQQAGGQGGAHRPDQAGGRGGGQGPGGQVQQHLKQFAGWVKTDTGLWGEVGGKRIGWIGEQVNWRGNQLAKVRGTLGNP